MKKSATHLSADQISVFCYQLSLMQKAGVQAEEGISILLEDATTNWEKSLYARIHDELLKGNPLSVALTESRAFPSYMLRMVEIGQASGRLEQVLVALSEFYQRESATQSAIRKAVAYPVFMAVLISLVFLVLMSQVLPVFEQVFDQLGMTLSPLAQSLMGLGDASQAVAAVISVVLILVAVFTLYLLYTKPGIVLSRKLGLSLFGKSLSQQAVFRSRFASAMALMLSSGIPIDEATERTSLLLEGTPLESKLKTVQAQLEEGVSFHKAVEEQNILTSLQSGLLAAGARAGVSEHAMEELARRCQEEADERLASMLGKFEYSLVLILCLSVGLVLLSVMLPLLGAMTAIGG